MRIVVKESDAKRFERTIIERYCLDDRSLTENAAKEAFDALLGSLEGRTILILAGPGGNGRDALEIAKILKAREFDFFVYPYLVEKFSEPSLALLKSVESNAVDRYMKTDVLIDGLFGVSFHGNLDDGTKELLDIINESGSYRFSLDTPSASYLNADKTVVFGFWKAEAFLPSERYKWGELYLRNPGFPEEDLRIGSTGLYKIEDEDLKIKGIRGDSYKNTRGHVLVMGGSKAFRGAPVLSSLSAFKASAGLVTLYSSEEVLNGANKFPSIIRVAELESLEKYSSIVMGPGWNGGREEDFKRALSSHLPLVIDSGAFEYLKRGVRLGGEAILTPHLGEFERLLRSYEIDSDTKSVDGLSEALRRLSKESESTVVLKSSVLWITKGDEIYIYDGFNPQMGVAGSGDVLAGIMGALFKETQSPLECAISSVIIHQRAGKRAREKYGYFTSEELLMEIRL